MAAGRTGSTMTFGEYLAEWFDTARPSLRPTTARGYDQAIVQVTSQLGRSWLQALTPMQVQRCYTQLLESGGRSGQRRGEQRIAVGPA